MLKAHAVFFRRLMITVDLCIVAAATFLVYLCRDFLKNIHALNIYFELLPVLFMIWGGLLYHFGMYRSFRVKKIPEILLIILKSAVLGFIIFGSFTYIFRLTYVSRLLIFYIFSLTAIFLSIEKIILILFFRYVRRKGLNYRNLLIVGTGKRAQRFIKLVKGHSEWGLRIIGLVDDEESKRGEVIEGYKVLGSFKDVPDIIHNNVVDEVVFVVPRAWLGKIEEIMHFCESEGLKVSVAVDYFELKFSKAKQTDLHGFPLLTFESTPDRVGQLFIKRVTDIVVSILALIFCAPLLIVISLLVKWSLQGPVIFKQTRCGFNWRQFTLYKFRTMVEDAEEKQQELAGFNEMKGPVFKLANDPRLTKIGRFLRRYSLDELPQFWNVLKGDMSLVGPRPPLPSEVQQYAPMQRRRLSMRPGLTCLWQIRGRNQISDFDEWVKLDLEYIDNWYLGLDFIILFRTIYVVLTGKGAK